MDQRNKYYTFTFTRYESERMKRHQEMYKRNMRFKIRVWGSVITAMVVLGMVYPVMMWF
jgi:hypothetical protein